MRCHHLLWYLQMVATYCKGLLPGAYPHVVSIAILKVSSMTCLQYLTLAVMLTGSIARPAKCCTAWRWYSDTEQCSANGIKRHRTAAHDVTFTTALLHIVFNNCMPVCRASKCIALLCSAIPVCFPPESEPMNHEFLCTEPCILTYATLQGVKSNGMIGCRACMCIKWSSRAGHHQTATVLHTTQNSATSNTEQCMTGQQLHDFLKQ